MIGINKRRSAWKKITNSLYLADLSNRIDVLTSLGFSDNLGAIYRMLQ